MNKAKKLLALLLLGTTLLSSLLVGCKKNKEDDDTSSDTSVSTSGTGSDYETDQWGQRVYDDAVPEDAKYGGKTVSVLMRNTGASDVRTYEWYTTSMEGSELNRAIYFRNIEIEEELEIEFDYIQRDDDEFSNYITTSCMTGGEGVDIISGYHYYHTSLQNMECYKNLMNSAFTYLKLDRPYWNQNFIKYAKSNDSLFVLLGDMNISAYMTTFSMYFNKTLLKDVCKLGDSDIYKTVIDGDWTIDKLIELVKNSAQLDGVDGDSDGDIYGYTSHYEVHAYDGFVSAFDIDMVQTKADGTHTLMDSTTQQKMLEAAQKLVDFYRTDDVYLVGKGVSSYTQPVAYFKQGRSIFCTASIGDSQHLSEMTDEYGLLPLPKYTDKQESYYAGVQDSHNSIAVMYGDKDYAMISAVLEKLAHKSYTSVRPTLFEKVIKYQQLKDADSVEVFDIILDSTRWDFSDIYPTSVQNVRNTLWRNALRNAVYGSGDAQGSVATAIAENKTAINEALKTMDEWLGTHK